MGAEDKTAMNGEERYFRRLSLWRLVEHHLNAVCFLVLCATGLAQRFHEAGWARSLIAAFGGIDLTRAIHRGSGALFAVLLAQHLLVSIYLVLWKGRTPSLMIRGRDFADALQDLRFCLKLSPGKARSGRFDYRQKFEYWGVVMGGILMITTGFMLWFPTAPFRWLPFLPGQIIPAVKVAHSSEATMAFLIIVIWHVYHAVLSPEVFPLDRTILTGKISATRMKHEHPLEYEEITGETLNSRDLHDPPEDPSRPSAGS